MGGCRCVYRSCQSSTSVTPGLHYFHFPVKDKVRCDQWVKNTQKPELHELSKEKLRNKVVCSLHFEIRYFTNEKQDRLVHNAVPTLGHDDPLFDPFANDNQQVQLIAMDEENTQFTMPDVEFAGKSYMIFNDSIVPTVKEQPSVKQPKKQFQVVIKKKIASPVTRNFSPQPKNPELSDDIVFKKTNDSGQIHAELKLEIQGDDSIPSYSMSELNGDLSLKLTDPVDQAMVIEEEPHVEHTFTLALPLKQTERPQKTQRPQQESPTAQQLLTKKEIYDIVKPWKNSNHDTNDITKQSQASPKPLKQKTYDLRSAKQEIGSVKPHNEEQYIQMIESNTKQIKTLKRLVQKQNKMNRFILQRKQMPHFRPRKLNKAALLESLKDQLKPSLLAILKLELLPVEEVILTDNEEKFIMDLYMEHPECYDLLRNKFNWNLPSNEVIAEANELDQ